MSIGEGGLEMGEDMGGSLVFGVRRRPRQRLGRRTASEQGGADLALGQVKPLPDALPGPLTPLALDVPAGGEDACGECELEEARQGVGGDAEPADFVGEPDAEGPAATGACLAVAAEYPPGTQGFSLGAGLVEAVQAAVPIQGANGLAMRTGDLLELLGKSQPFVVVAEKPALAAHETMSPKSPFYLSGAR